MDTREVINQIIFNTVKKYGTTLEMITDDKSIIGDLGADSLDTIELMLAFEESFKISITERDIGSIVTVKDIYDFVESRYAQV